jgi:hypothetical protein
MRIFGLILLLAGSGCAHRELLSGEQSEATAQVRRWVQAGTSVADARHVMEQHGFTCSPVTNGMSSLECDYRSSASLWNMVLVCGYASFPVEDAKVHAAQVSTYLRGP